MISGRILLSKWWDFGGLFISSLSSSTDSINKESREEEEKNSRGKTKHQPANPSLLLFLVWKEEEEEEVEAKMVIATESQFHVLAVDDSLIDRKLIERLLKTSSFQVTTVESGSKALEFLGLQDEKATPPSSSPPPDQHAELFQELEVNLIITDYCMPGMTGYELLKKVKESSSLKDIPVVIMSSENVPSRINRCLEGGAEEFLLKPVKLSDMSKLRPHILKGKNKDHQLPNNSVTSSSSNKRKAMDEEEDFSLQRTRPRFSLQ